MTAITRNTALRDGAVHMACVGDRLRQAARDVATARVLERLAERSANAPLAALLLDRARRHRRRAEQIRADVEVPPRA